MAVGFNPSTIITKPIIPAEEGEDSTCSICLSSFKVLNEGSETPFVEGIFSGAYDSHSADVEEVALRAFGHYTQMHDGSQGEPHLFCERCFVQSREASPACALCRQVLTDSDHVLSPLSMTQEERGEAVVNAADAGNLVTLQALLSTGAISERARGEAVKQAALNNRLDIIQALLLNGSILEEERGSAVIFASTEGNLDIIHVLLASGSIPTQKRDVALSFASFHSHLPILQALLANNAIVSDNARGSAFIHAASNNRVDIMQALLAFGATVSQEHRGTALNHTARLGHVDATEEILRIGAITQIDRERALTTAAEHGRLEIRNIILHNS